MFTGGNRVASGTQTVTAAARVIHGGVDITSELPASAFTWTRDSGRSAEDATWNAAHQNVKQVTLTSADMNGDVQIACSVRGSAATFGSITVGSDYAVSYTRSAADAGDTLSLSSGILSVETSTNTYSLDDGSLKVVSGFTGTVTASATVFFERPAQVMEFSYNMDGMRAEKKVTRLGVETTTYYTYSGKKLTHLICGTDSMHFFYDGQGRPATVQYDDGSTTGNYTYVHNLQGDIAGILDSAGTLVVEYHYDAWGKPLSTTGTLATTLGTENPFRYRGYIYDVETGYYYLRSRYYDPGLRRFVNSDSIIDTRTMFFNTFTYCINNPVMNIDPSGMITIGGKLVNDSESNIIHGGCGGKFGDSSDGGWKWLKAIGNFFKEGFQAGAALDVAYLQTQAVGANKLADKAKEIAEKVYGWVSEQIDYICSVNNKTLAYIGEAHLNQAYAWMALSNEDMIQHAFAHGAAGAAGGMVLGCFTGPGILLGAIGGFCAGFVESIVYDMTISFMEGDFE